MTLRETLLALLAVYFLFKWLGLKERVLDALLALDKIPSPHFMVSQAVQSLVGEPWRFFWTDAREQAREVQIRQQDALRRRDAANERWLGHERPDDGTPPPPPRP